MIEMFSQGFVVNALIIILIIGLLLSYLGVHVVRRGIVFVDLALGQISMLGVAFAMLIHQEPTLISIILTMAGAFFLSLIHIKDKRLKQEAIIGIIYAIATAVTVLLIAKSPHGETGISEVLFGSFFTVTVEDIGRISLVFSLIGLGHFLLRKKFFFLTQMYETRLDSKVEVFNVWNFLFYLSLGLAIVLAVRVGGVIPVFAYLIIPAVSAIMLAKSEWAVVLIAIVMSFLGGIFGLLFALEFDFPAGSSVVTVLGGIFAVASIVRFVKCWFH